MRVMNVIAAPLETCDQISLLVNCVNQYVYHHIANVVGNADQVAVPVVHNLYWVGGIDAQINTVLTLINKVVQYEENASEDVSKDMYLFVHDQVIPKYTIPQLSTIYAFGVAQLHQCHI